MKASDFAGAALSVFLFHFPWFRCQEKGKKKALKNNRLFS